MAAGEGGAQSNRSPTLVMHPNIGNRYAPPNRARFAARAIIGHKHHQN